MEDYSDTKCTPCPGILSCNAAASNSHLHRACSERPRSISLPPHSGASFQRCLQSFSDRLCLRFPQDCCNLHQLQLPSTRLCVHLFLRQHIHYQVVLQRSHLLSASLCLALILPFV